MIDRAKGYTVRRAGEPAPNVTRPRNLLERAAMTDDVEEAARMIKSALGITNGDLAFVNLDANWLWSRKSSWSRLEQIGNWLRAECFECMDLVEADTPMSVVGTND